MSEQLQVKEVEGAQLTTEEVNLMKEINSVLEANDGTEKSDKDMLDAYKMLKGDLMGNMSIIKKFDTSRDTANGLREKGLILTKENGQDAIIPAGGDCGWSPDPGNSFDNFSIQGDDITFQEVDTSGNILYFVQILKNDEGNYTVNQGTSKDNLQYATEIIVPQAAGKYLNQMGPGTRYAIINKIN